MTTTHPSGLEVRRWTRAEYEQLIEHGLFRPDERLELIDGEILTVAPPSPLHVTGIGIVQEALRAAWGPGAHVRTQAPIALDPMSEPEPDVSVVSGSVRDYRDAHPALPLLVVEVSHTSLAFDQGRKGSLYARARIPEYWIVNVGFRQLEVYRDPAESESARYGWAYGAVLRLGAAEKASPLAAPQARIAVADLLP